MARFTSKTSPVERISSYGQTLSCPHCGSPFALKDTKDGDQAYWCHTCERGWRAGHLPPEARRTKAKALLEVALENTAPEATATEFAVLETPPQANSDKQKARASTRAVKQPSTLGIQQDLFASVNRI